MLAADILREILQLYLSAVRALFEDAGNCRGRILFNVGSKWLAIIHGRIHRSDTNRTTATRNARCGRAWERLGHHRAAVFRLPAWRSPAAINGNRKNLGVITVRCTG